VVDVEQRLPVAHEEQKPHGRNVPGGFGTRGLW
jgi:hypothetical protein